MSGGPGIREALPADLAGIERLYASAFPQEDLRPLVRELATLGAGAVSLVAVVGPRIAGHVAFTSCGIGGAENRLALLGPLAVAPDLQRQGIGAALVRAGLDRLGKAGACQVHVLGDPIYYRRFGFAAETGIQPPYVLPEAWRPAWQSLRLGGNGAPLCGTLSVPPPWQRPALWGP